MISETASKEEIGRMDELPAGSTGQSRKRNEIEDDEEVDHVARIHEFFSRDTVIISALVVQCTVAILSYQFLYSIFRYIGQLFKGIHITISLPTKILLYFFSSGIPHDHIIAIILFIILPFIGIYHLFRKRKKLFFYYFLATFPPEVLILFVFFFSAMVLSPIIQTHGPMK